MVLDEKGSIRTVPTPRASGPYRGWLLYRELSFHNTWLDPLLLLLFFGAWWYLFAKDDPSHWLNMFVKVSYPIPGTNPVQYSKGKKDFAFVAFYMLFFTFWREFWMQVVLRRLAVFFGLRRKGRWTV
jgi:acyl-CoA-dependent ceramide synthase